ncbi:MAG: 4-hydroxy-tetrahydrodipicolinate reductase [Erysipelotrichaceae bacterium]|nr:4-hydroxy-tetrahydrodipicolinate reductase [Erysipelotrichaceae bacterium]
MRIILYGYTGRMGQMLVSLLAKHPEHEIAAYVAIDSNLENDRCYRSLADCSAEADVLIDFSNHASAKEITEWCVSHKMPAVICTTGHDADEKQMIRDASETIPVFLSANMSIGIAVLARIAREAVKMFPDADIEIVEKHHNQKLDVPSGTALLLADAIKEERSESEYVIGRHENGKRRKEEIGIHSLRLGSEVGTHEIYIHTGNECLTLSHEAQSRAVFADGALAAAEYLITCGPGLYNMNNMIAK